MRRTVAGRSIWLLRHASRLDFEDPTWHQGAPRPHDPPLSAKGEREAHAAADRLSPEPIRELFSSPFLRCVQTASAVAERLELAIRIEPGLSEWLNVDWFPRAPSLLSAGELLRFAHRLDVSYQPRGAARYGESGLEALRRSGDVARRLAAEFPGDLVLVGHGASVLGAAAGLLDIAPADAGKEPPIPDLPYGSLSRLLQQNDAWQLELCGDTSHLRALERSER